MGRIGPHQPAADANQPLGPSVRAPAKTPDEALAPLYSTSVIDRV
jgi:hypothetical protein